MFYRVKEVDVQLIGLFRFAHCSSPKKARDGGTSCIVIAGRSIFDLVNRGELAASMI